MTELNEEILKIENLNHYFQVNGEEFQVLKDINLTVNKGEFITIVGHSGCGKSTLLRIIAGLQKNSEGTVIRNGKPLTEPDSDCGMVFQEHRLLPWLKIKDNVGFGLEGKSRAEKDKLVKDYIKLVHLDGFENAYPKQLSGGMAQRAAIARGLVTNPDILLLDEPFGALDALTRIQMQKEVLNLWNQKKITMILVTHDIDEAIFLGQRVIVMSSRPGEIKEIIKIESNMAKKRGSLDASYYKRKIYKYFFEDSEEEIDYVI
ncbi:MAG: ABC transporter ATP-binding protein [Eubacteriales bacterium]|nr:ABC transporter ATP-binding protein [Eubacteriales bacterium]